MGLDAVAAEAPPGKPPRVSGDRPPGRLVFTADAAGSLFPLLPFSCIVQSVFRSALNLKISTDPHLVSLIADPRHAHPRGAVILGARFDEWTIERGSSGYFDGSRLSFADADAPRVLVAPERADADERAPAIARSPGLVACLGRAAGLVAAARAERGSRAILVGTELGSTRAKGGTELAAGAPAGTPLGTELPLRDDFFTVCLRSAASDLAEAFSARSVEAALGAAERMVGLGTGLTPSGDDFLCGFLAARRSISAENGRGTRFLDSWGQSLAADGDRALSRTNEISAAFLASAAAGRFSTALVTFGRAIAAEAEGRGDRMALAAAVTALSFIGHGSGLDAAEGFLYGLQRGVEEHDDEA